MRDSQSARPPSRIETERLVLRCWTPDDAPLLREALDCSLEHLRPWMPWALDEPATLEETTERLASFQAAFESGEDYVYAILDPAESLVLGGTGLHPRVGAGGLEIGYWIRADQVQQGYATETARALTEVGLGVEGITFMRIHVDPRNAASRAVPVRLGYRLIERLKGAAVDSGGNVRDTLIFERRRRRSAPLEHGDRK